MSTRSYSIRRARLVPDLDDPNLYGAWGMVPQGGLLVDHTVQGNDGTPGAASVVENTILGPMRRYLPNIGADASVMGAANAFALNDVTVSLWCRPDVGAGSFYAMNYFASVNDAWGILFVGGNSIRVSDDIDNANTQLYATDIQEGSLVHVVAGLSSLDNFLYVNGVLVGSGTAASDDWASFAGTLYHGGRLTGSTIADGIVSPIPIYNAAKDQTWVTKEYEKGARACQFKTDWGVRASIAVEGTAGATVGVNSSPLEIVSGSWVITMDTIEGRDVKVLTCATSGRVAIPCSLFEATPAESAFGTWDFWLYHSDGSTTIISFIASATSFVTNVDQIGYYFQVSNAETPSIRESTGGATAELAAGTVGGFTAGVWHQCRLTRRYDGRFRFYQDGVRDIQVTDLTTTDSAYFVLDFDSGDRFAYSDARGDHCFQKLLGEVAP